MGNQHKNFLLINESIVSLSLILFISFFVNLLIINIFKKRTFCEDGVESNKPQRFHDIPTPRAGGIGIFISVTIGLLVFEYALQKFSFKVLYSAFYSLSKTRHIFLYIVLASLPVFLIGFYEDMKSNTSHRMRLMVIGIGAIMGIFLMDSTIYNLGICKLPFWIAIPFTVFAIVGVTNAINIIDGFNGLASGISIIALSFFAFTSYIHGDLLIFTISLFVISAIIGFFIWNFPKGKIFLGDSGAYFIGFVLALISIFLVNRNPQISPWFPFILLMYPIFEVLFSIYRRKFKRGFSSFEPDAMHLHTLIYRRITKKNYKTSVYLWTLAAFFNAIAFPFRMHTLPLIIIFFMFSVTYIYLYRRIVRFKVG